jgi:hypothetical protein
MAFHSPASRTVVRPVHGFSGAACIGSARLVVREQSQGTLGVQLWCMPGRDVSGPYLEKE